MSADGTELLFLADLTARSARTYYACVGETPPVPTELAISPEALGDLASDPSQIPDRISASYMVAVAARTIRDLAVLQRRAARAGKRLATLNLQADVRFANAADRNAFSEELTNSIAQLVAKYHNGDAPGGRSFRFFLGAYPAITKQEDDPGDTGDASVNME